MESVRAAAEAGASRIELCAALSEGGLTPSAGLIRAAVELAGRYGVPVNVLIRPRPGDFCYTPEEVDMMLADIDQTRALGANGIVTGALRPGGEPDAVALDRISRASEGMDRTFHRAFDVCSDPDGRFGEIAGYGFNRVLTSGCAPTALQGAERLKIFRERADRHGVSIMAGGGVSPANAAEIASRTGVEELHGSFRKPLASLMQFRVDDVKMGDPQRDEYTRLVADRDAIEETIRILAGL